MYKKTKWGDVKIGQVVYFYLVDNNFYIKVSERRGISFFSSTKIEDLEMEVYLVDTPETKELYEFYCSSKGDLNGL